jgi:putative ABC transport system permease protein
MVFSLIAGYTSTKRILKMDPAQSMRSELPASGKRVLVERIRPLWKRLSFGWKMSIRNIFRVRQRAVITIVGFVFTVVLLIGSLFFIDSIDYMKNQYYKDLQKQDYKIFLSDALPLAKVKEIINTKGISRLEPILEVPVEIRKDSSKSDIMLTALEDGNTLYRLKDESGNDIGVPKVKGNPGIVNKRG